MNIINLLYVALAMLCANAILLLLIATFLAIGILSACPKDRARAAQKPHRRNAQIDDQP